MSVGKRESASFVFLSGPVVRTSIASSRFTIFVCWAVVVHVRVCCIGFFSLWAASPFLPPFFCHMDIENVAFSRLGDYMSEERGCNSILF